MPADPANLLQSLASVAPDVSLVQSAQLEISRLDTELATKLSSDLKEDEKAKIKEETEKAKLPYKSIVSLFELHKIYSDQGLLNNNNINNINTDETTKKTLEILKSFSEKNSNITPVLNDVAKLVANLKPELTQTIDLSGQNLSGQNLIALSRSICQRFTNLKSLDLSNNQLKELPQSIGDLENLETLDLHSNQLTCLPDSMGFLGNLKVLDVSANMLVILPESLGGCRKMVHLNVGFNQLQRLPQRIGYDLRSLQILCLHSNKLQFLPSSVCELKRLKTLDLHFNNIKSLPPNLGNMSDLEKLNISNNFSDFGGMIPESIGDLDLLIELDVSFNQIKVLPDSIGALPNLNILKVDNNPLVMPPLEVVEHSMQALIEYMQEKWKMIQTYDDGDVRSSPSPSPRPRSWASPSPSRGWASPFHPKASPSRLNNMKVGSPTNHCSSSPLSSWFSSMKCTGKNSPNLQRIYSHKLLNEHRSS